MKEHLVKSTTVFHGTLKTSVGELRGEAARERERKKSNKSGRIKEILILYERVLIFFSTGLPTSTLSVISLEKGKKKEDGIYTKERDRKTKRGSAG